MAKSYREQLCEIAAKYSREFDKEYSLDDLVKWAIDSNEWSLSSVDEFRIARDHFRKALKDAKDDSGVREFIDAKLQQTHLWAHRQEASWQLRQAFVSDQCRRAVNQRNAALTICAVLNAERKQGEAPFQAVFEWDEDESIEA